MRVFIVGGGGREHALAWGVSRSPRLDKLYAYPGNAGIAECAEIPPLPGDEIGTLVDFARGAAIDLTIVGPEAPLDAGIVDEFSRAGLTIFGPTQAAARLESSKAFAKQLMASVGVPSAQFGVFDDFNAAWNYGTTHRLPLVVKADGLAGGKGALICETPAKLEKALDAMLHTGAFGLAGKTVVIEEFLQGEEVSLFVLADGSGGTCVLASAQDYKRIGEGDTGPNTGGMGAYSPVGVVNDELVEHVMRSVVEPTLKGMAAAGAPFAGMLYAGLMLTQDGPRVIEFNCRFGDPETQAIVPRVADDLLMLIYAAATGHLPVRQVNLTKKKAACVVLASEGYPGRIQTGHEITGIGPDDYVSVVFHSGTKVSEGKTVTDGGRVLGVTGMGATIRAAVHNAYMRAERIHFKGKILRRDIAWRELDRSKGSSG
ncbi:MAG: phosphoribosylamine--glycine ligase [Candidatus Coatesbacteria bacterium RBG_13_66_14]|uniref:Phosphoribosylamine--glycine ligase n=1 Tax=Candidatus Coatesbacteria bacterium RBG_13_66_14 TaxID=1817816 RepID=A0A1F5F2H2_9BACT|nr:MAG: phosphoribosylamine--glycine ligase [Candidatus Coatesbacteria bacterium RBG_13_66_14]